MCPACGEPLRHDWLRPILIGAIVVIGAAVGLVVAVWLRQSLLSFRPSVAVSTVQAVVSEVPILVQVPTLTPSLTPSVTPTPTNTPRPTATPSMTPSPTLTPTPTETPSPTPTRTPTATPTKAYPTWTPKPKETPTATPTPAPTVALPTLEEPEDEAPFSGVKAIIKLAWSSSHTLKPGECYLVTVRWTEGGAPTGTENCVQETFWFVDESLYLRADQETDRAYRWSVRVVRKETDSNGDAVFAPLSSSSEERSFYWE